MASLASRIRFSASRSADALVNALASFSNATGSASAGAGGGRRASRSHLSYMARNLPMNSALMAFSSSAFSSTASSTSAASKLISSTCLESSSASRRTRVCKRASAASRRCVASWATLATSRDAAALTLAISSALARRRPRSCSSRSRFARSVPCTA